MPPKSIYRRKVRKPVARKRIWAPIKKRYPKRKIAYPKLKQDKAKVHGGYLDQSLAFNHGRGIKLSSKFISKVREAGASLDTQVFKTVGTYQAPGNSSSSMAIYWGSPTLYQVADMLQIQTNIEGNIGNSGVDPSSIKATIMDVNLQCQIINSSNAQAEVRVYECQARHDIPYSYGSINYPITSLTNGFIQADQAGQINDPTSTPFQSPEFVSKYKVLRVRNLKFNPGETKLLTLSDKSPNNINFERWFTTTNTPQIYCPAKRGRFLLFQGHGQIMTNVAGPSTSINYSNNIFHAYYTQSYKFKFIREAKSEIFVYTGTDAQGLSVLPANLGMTGAFISNTTGLKVDEIDV